MISKRTDGCRYNKSSNVLSSSTVDGCFWPTFFLNFSRLLQLSNYLKVPINYFFEDFSEYLVNLEKSKEGHMNVNYNFLVKLYSELNSDQKLKFNKSLQISSNVISKVV